MRKWIIAGALSLFVVVPAFAQSAVCLQEPCKQSGSGGRIETTSDELCLTESCKQGGSGGRSVMGSGGRVATTSDELCLTDDCRQGGSGGRSVIGSGGRTADGVWTLQTIELAGTRFTLGMLELADGTILWIVR